MRPALRRRHSERECLAAPKSRTQKRPRTVRARHEPRPYARQRVTELLGVGVSALVFALIVLVRIGNAIVVVVLVPVERAVVVGVGVVGARAEIVFVLV